MATKNKMFTMMMTPEQHKELAGRAKRMKVSMAAYLLGCGLGTIMPELKGEPPKPDPAPNPRVKQKAPGCEHGVSGGDYCYVCKTKVW